MTQIAAPPRCVIDMFHLEPFSISGLLSLREKNSPSSINLCPVVGLVHITPEESENESFTLKTHQMFSVHTMRQCAQSLVILNLCLRKTWSGRSRDYRDVIVFEKLCFQNVFSPTRNKALGFSNSTGLKGFLEKLRFRDGLVWTGRPKRRSKAAFQISPAQCEHCRSQQ